MRELTMEEIEFVSGGTPTCQQASDMAGGGIGAVLGAIAGGATEGAWGGVGGAIIGGIVGGLVALGAGTAAAGGLASQCTSFTQASKVG
jgi:hypothetical protein